MALNLAHSICIAMDPTPHFSGPFASCCTVVRCELGAAGAMAPRVILGATRGAVSPLRFLLPNALRAGYEDVRVWGEGTHTDVLHIHARGAWGAVRMHGQGVEEAWRRGGKDWISGCVGGGQVHFL